MSTATYPVLQERWARPMVRVCPDCTGSGYTTIEIRERVTVWEPDYPVTVPVVAYKTRPCWRCKGRGMIEEGR